MLEQEGRKEMCELPSERVSELTVDASKGKKLPLNHLYRSSLSLEGMRGTCIRRFIRL